MGEVFFGTSCPAAPLISFICGFPLQPPLSREVFVRPEQARLKLLKQLPYSRHPERCRIWQRRRCAIGRSKAGGGGRGRAAATAIGPCCTLSSGPKLLLGIFNQPAVSILYNHNLGDLCPYCWQVEQVLSPSPTKGHGIPIRSFALCTELFQGSLTKQTESFHSESMPTFGSPGQPGPC